VGAALHRVWPQLRPATETAAAHAGAPIGSWEPTRADVGRLLDECGSDHRPLVDLLLDIGRTVRPVLTGCAPHSGSSWDTLRAPLVHKLVSTRFLQPDVARWAVDAWALALGVVTAVEPPTLATANGSDATHAPNQAGVVEGRAGARTPAATLAGRPPGARAPALHPLTVSPQHVPAPLRNVPSWAGGPVSFRVGQRPKQASLAALAQRGGVVVRAGSSAGGPRFQQVERRAAMVLGALLVVISGALLHVFRERPTPAPLDAAGVGALEPTTQVSQVSPESTATAMAIEPDSPIPSGAVSAAATVRASASPAAIHLDGRIRHFGVAGRYVVSQRVLDVRGTESCNAVARALGAGRETEEVVSHAPGALQFSLTTRGVVGTLDSDGQFISEPRSGTTNNVNWQFRMRGRFGPEGFTGESVTHTDAILRWGKLQNCVVTAELTGRRLPD